MQINVNKCINTYAQLGAFWAPSEGMPAATSWVHVIVIS